MRSACNVPNICASWMFLTLKGFLSIFPMMQSSQVLQVSALHYLARDWVSEGFQTVASAHALHQPTSCRSEYFYNQHPQVRNLIRTECSLIEVSIGLRRKQAKSNSIDGFRNTEVFPIDLDFRL